MFCANPIDPSASARYPACIKRLADLCLFRATLVKLSIFDLMHERADLAVGALEHVANLGNAPASRDQQLDQVVARAGCGLGHDRQSRRCERDNFGFVNPSVGQRECLCRRMGVSVRSFARASVDGSAATSLSVHIGFRGVVITSVCLGRLSWSFRRSSSRRSPVTGEYATTSRGNLPPSGVRPKGRSRIRAGWSLSWPQTRRSRRSSQTSCETPLCRPSSRANRRYRRGRSR